MTQINFSKWHGLGNDYIIIASPDFALEMTPGRAAAICDRHFGIGSDGILLWDGSENAGFRLEIYNPDGSRAEMCGNGIRMLARYLHERGFTSRESFAVQTDAGLISPTLLPDGQVRVHMGKARLGGNGIIGFEGVIGESEALGVKLEAAGEEFAFTFVDIGNPHCIIETDDLEMDLEEMGPLIENHQLFPGRVNVEFMRILGPAEVAMRVWERGVGETNACGTGACAVAVAANRRRGLASPVTVHLPGGDLVVEVGPEMEVNMTGPATEIFSGAMSAAFVVTLEAL